MPFIVGGIAAMAALVGGILAKIDPVSCLTRSLLAFFVGWIAAQLWQLILTLVGQNQKTAGIREDEVEEEKLPAA